MIAVDSLRRPSPIVWTTASIIAVALGVKALIPVLSGSNGIYLLIAIPAAIGGLITIVTPIVGLAAILVVWMTDISPALFGQRFLTIPYLATAVLLVPLGVTLVRDRTIRFLEVPLARLLLAIGAVHLLSTLWNNFVLPIHVPSDGDGTTRDLVVFAARLLFLAFVFYFVTTPRRIEGMLWLVVGLIVAAAVLSWGPLLFGGGRRAEAWLLNKNANRLALLSLFATAMIWSVRTWGGDERWKLASLPLLFGLPATVLASGSRSGLLMAGALLALVLGERRDWSRGRLVRTFLLLACGAVLVLTVVPDTTIERTVQFDTSLSAPGGRSLQSRIAQHEAAMHLYLAHPLLGIGIGNFEALAGDLFNVDDTLHNSYLLAVIEGGPILLGLYVWLFVVTWQTLRRLEREGPPDFFWLVKGLRFGLAVFLVASVTADIWLNELLYVILGLTIALAALPHGTSGPVRRPADPAQRRVAGRAVASYAEVR